MSMEKIVSLCRRRGFLFQSSEIYGGLQGFWDYGPLGVELKRNVKESWWRSMVLGHNQLVAPAGAPNPYEMVGLDCTIIMHPQVWKCSGHFDLFHDMMVDCRSCKSRYRADHLMVYHGKRETDGQEVWASGFGSQEDVAAQNKKKLRGKDAQWAFTFAEYSALDSDRQAQVPCPECDEAALTEPREFNLMFETHTGAVKSDSSKAFLRPETAQGIFVNFKNVLDSTRVKLPFGIAQVGKSFRNEITPRNFTFRSREFEQMEVEFFCQPELSQKWYQYWRDRRMNWYTELGLASERLRLREHDPDELSHYSTGTADIEYAFPFLPEGEFGELEGIAHRGDFDLRSHMEGKLDPNSNPLEVQRDANGQPLHRGSGKDLTYFDDEAFERDKEQLGVKSFKAYLKSREGEAVPGAPYQYVPHVIEPSSGADRATLAFLCEAYTEDEAPDEKGVMKTRTVMKFHPSLAPIKAAVFPLVKKDGMPEVAKQVYGELKQAGLHVFYDEKGAVGRRYRRQDEIGTPYCITVDGQTLEDQTVTVRDRDSLDQWRISLNDVVGDIQQRIG